MRVRAGVVAVVVTVAAVLTSAGAAQAQEGADDENRAAARSAAVAGATAMNEGRFAEAADLFTRAEALVHAPTHLLYLARTQVKLGRSSVNTVEILSGLKVGDQVILSDMSAYDAYDRIRLK